LVVAQVTEKIHGANFSLITDGRRVWAAKRRGLLSTTTTTTTATTAANDFFDYQHILDALTPNMLALFHWLKQENASLDHVQVVGELFGGGYPHPDVRCCALQPPNVIANPIPTLVMHQVPTVPNVSLVQTGIYYHPEIRFCAFDVVLLSQADGDRYLDFDRALACLQSHGVCCNRHSCNGATLRHVCCAVVCSLPLLLLCTDLLRQATVHRHLTTGVAIQRQL
jgi:Rnl2 family RNA ligase